MRQRILEAPFDFGALRAPTPRANGMFCQAERNVPAPGRYCWNVKTPARSSVCES